MITITPGGGDFSSSHSREYPDLSVDEAILEAKQILRDDPELGAVEVYKDGTYIGCATHVPNQDWQSVVGWLWDGEHVLPPAVIDPDGNMREADSEGYAPTDPKHPTYHDRMSDFADLRD